MNKSIASRWDLKLQMDINSVLLVCTQAGVHNVCAKHHLEGHSVGPKPYVVPNQSGGTNLESQEGGGEDDDDDDDDGHGDASGVNTGAIGRFNGTPKPGNLLTIK